MAFTQPDLSSNIAAHDELRAAAHLRNFAVSDARNLDESADAVFHPVVGEDFLTASYLRFLGYQPARNWVPGGLQKALRGQAPAEEVRWLVKVLNDLNSLKRDQEEADRLAWAQEAAEERRSELEESRHEFEVFSQKERLLHELKPAAELREQAGRFRLGFESIPAVDNPGARSVFLGLAMEFSKRTFEIKDRAKAPRARAHKKR
jgi:hypothetical protein